MAHLYGVQVLGVSNPLGPTKQIKGFRKEPFLFLHFKFNDHYRPESDIYNYGLLCFSLVGLAGCRSVQRINRRHNLFSSVPRIKCGLILLKNAYSKFHISYL